MLTSACWDDLVRIFGKQVTPNYRKVAVTQFQMRRTGPKNGPNGLERCVAYEERTPAVEVSRIGIGDRVWCSVQRIMTNLSVGV